MLLVATVVGWLLLCAAAPESTEEPVRPVKVYVVKTPGENDGRPDTLNDIASRALGERDRAGEIFRLNEGRRQADGGALTDPDELVPGWVLELPEDASGPDVQVGFPVQTSGRPPDGTSVGGTTSGADTDPPMAPTMAPGEEQPGPTPAAAVAAVVAGAAVVAVLAVLLAVPRTRTWLGGPVARFSRRAAGGRVRRHREQLGERMRDRSSVVAARAAIGELVGGGAPGEPPTRVYTAQVSGRRVTAQVSSTSGPPPGWTAQAPHRWTRAPGPAGTPAARVPRLVRVGSTGDGGWAMVDLAHLDGVLSIFGSTIVARDLLDVLTAELIAGAAETGVPPGLVVASADRAAPGIRWVSGVADLLPRGHPPASSTSSTGPVVAAARVRPAAPVLILPTWSPADLGVLTELTGPAGEWNAIVIGDVPDAHWRWTAAPDGTVDLGSLDLVVTVPLVGGTPQHA